MAASPCFCRRRSGGSLLVGSDRRVRGAVERGAGAASGFAHRRGGLVGVGCDWPPRPAGIRGDWNGIRTRLSRVRRSSRRIWGLIPPVSVTPREERNGWLRRFFNPAMSTLPTARSPCWAGSAMLGEYHDAGGGVASASGGRQISPPSVPVQTPHRRGAPTPTGQPTPVAPPRQRYSGRSGIDAWCRPFPATRGEVWAIGHSGPDRAGSLICGRRRRRRAARLAPAWFTLELTLMHRLIQGETCGPGTQHQGSKEAVQEIVRSTWQTEVSDPRQGACPKRLGESRSARVPSGTEEGSRRRKEAVPKHRQRKDQEILDCGRLSDSTVNTQSSVVERFRRQRGLIPERRATR